MPPHTVSGFPAAAHRRGTSPTRSKEVQTVAAVSSALVRAGQSVTAIVEPGEHAWTFARRQFAAALHWLARTPPPTAVPR